MATTRTSDSGNVREHALDIDKFLTVSVNVLHKELFEKPRTEAKGIYRDLQDGKVMPLTRLQMEDQSLVLFTLSLDSSEYRGKLNFGSFRTGLGVLISNIAEALKSPETLRTFHNQQNPRAMLFGVTALTVEEGETSVLALGADPSAGPTTVQLQLMYLPYEQFAEGQEPGPEITA